MFHTVMRKIFLVIREKDYLEFVRLVPHQEQNEILELEGVI